MVEQVRMCFFYELSSQLKIIGYVFYFKTNMCSNTIILSINWYLNEKDEEICIRLDK